MRHFYKESEKNLNILFLEISHGHIRSNAWNFQNKHQKADKVHNYQNLLNNDYFWIILKIQKTNIFIECSFQILLRENETFLRKIWKNLNIFCLGKSEKFKRNSHLKFLLRIIKILRFSFSLNKIWIEDQNCYWMFC